MPRPDPHSDYREILTELLERPEIKERFAELEKITVNALVEEQDPDEILRIVSHLKVLRQFKKGVASVTQITKLKEARHA